MPYSYTKTTWTNNSGEALNAENLDNLDTGAFKGNAHIGTTAPADTAREWYDTNTSPHPQGVLLANLRPSIRTRALALTR